jgi:hypothetical protein
MIPEHSHTRIPESTPSRYRRAQISGITEGYRHQVPLRLVTDAVRQFGNTFVLHRTPKRLFSLVVAPGASPQ